MPQDVLGSNDPKPFYRYVKSHIGGKEKADNLYTNLNICYTFQSTSDGIFTRSGP